MNENSNYLAIKLFQTADLPQDVRGGIIEDGSGGYIIAVQNALTNEQKAKTIAHELLHIFENDFDRCNVAEIEKRAHRTAQETF